MRANLLNSKLRERIPRRYKSFLVELSFGLCGMAKKYSILMRGTIMIGMLPGNMRESLWPVLRLYLRKISKNVDARTGIMHGSH